MQPEARLSQKIQKAIRARGAWCFKVHGGPMQMSGVPDILACYRGVFVGLETKMPGGDTSNIQEYVHGQMRRAGGVVAVVRSVVDATNVLDVIDVALDSVKGASVDAEGADTLSRSDTLA